MNNSVCMFKGVKSNLCWKKINFNALKWLENGLGTSGTMNSHNMQIRNTLPLSTNHLHIRNDRFTEFCDITTKLMHSSTAQVSFIQKYYVSGMIGSHTVGFVTSETELLHSPTHSSVLYRNAMPQLWLLWHYKLSLCITSPPNQTYIEVLCVRCDTSKGICGITNWDHT